ncbi:hypothetical protein Sjap_022909 [Stephania japonica]|uniref:General transcription factor 3C polypeptide 5 n=1 Tax=Stephania japonica TaxID=461633 RepID=A0AAP0EV66_9MAGN
MGIFGALDGPSDDKGLVAQLLLLVVLGFEEVIMGVVKDGTVSGILPGSEGFAVYYPGYPSSVDRAVETLGGAEGLLKARSSKSNFLELHFRPEDPYSHPTFGALSPSSNLLLKITNKINNRAQEAVITNNAPRRSSTEIVGSKMTSCSSETVKNREQNDVSNDATASSDVTDGAQLQGETTSASISVDIVARVSETYHFNGMVDYQHVLPVHADALRKKKRNWVEVEPRFERGGLMDIDQEDLMILLPPLFSPKDMPENLVLRPSSALSAKKRHETVVKHYWEIPQKIDWEHYITRGAEHWESQMAVSKLFDERPIWVKSSLKDRLLDGGLKFGTHSLKRLLFRVGYYFSTGPFRQFWIRKGYDPRVDPQSRILDPMGLVVLRPVHGLGYLPGPPKPVTNGYQSIDFRVPPPLRNSLNFNTKSKCDWKGICAFRVFPSQCQISLQLCDLVDDYIQQEIRKPTKQTTCSNLTGWLSPHEVDTLRVRVAVRFLSVYPKVGAEALLKSASIRFEKLKRAVVLKEDSKSGEVGPRHVNRDSSMQPSSGARLSKADTELFDGDSGDERGDEEDDNNRQYELEEEEEEEEELDEYEAIQEISDSTVETNFSKDYLMELFGSFPAGGAGNSNVLGADSSDGEYQILEHDNGDNDYYSDDDY